jgi:hypothetical protein
MRYKEGSLVVQLQPQPGYIQKVLSSNDVAIQSIRKGFLETASPGIKKVTLQRNMGIDVRRKEGVVWELSRGCLDVI